MSLKQQAVSGAMWSFAQQFSIQLINFGVRIVLARLLLPEDFGLIAMITIFISIGQSLMDGGMTSSLIRMKNPSQLDYSTVFVTNMIVSIGLYLIIYILSPYVAEFYNQNSLINILRIFALSFIIKSFVAVHLAKLTKEMNFKTEMKLQIPSTIISAIIGVFMAYKGFGVWSLVWLNLIQTAIFTIQVWLFIKWRPSFIFKRDCFKYHFNFGYKLTLSGILDALYRNIYTIIIGKAFNPTLVGYFNQAETMRLFPVQQISVVMGKVTYPLFSNIDNDISLKRAYKMSMKLQFLCVVPMMFFLILVGRELFLLMFGERWLPSVPYFQILSIASIMLPLTTYNLNILKVKGRSDILLKLEIIKKTLGFICVFISAPFGLMTMVISYLFISIFNTFINMFFSGKLINYFLLEQIRDCSKIFVTGIISLVLAYYFKVYFLENFSNIFLILFIIGLVYMLAYLFILWLLEREMFGLVKNLIK